jgi:hypothetical protein
MTINLKISNYVDSIFSSILGKINDREEVEKEQVIFKLFNL